MAMDDFLYNNSDYSGSINWIYYIIIIIVIIIFIYFWNRKKDLVNKND